MAVTKTWASTGDTSWTTAGNWSPAAVPVPADTAVINLGTLGPNVIVTGATASAVEVGTTSTGGALTVSAGGGLSDSNGYLGFNIGSSGTANITGTGSKWANTGSFIVGNNGAGTLNVQSGGTVTALSSTIASGASSSGTATIDGTSSKWTNTSGLTVGSAGTGALTISNGGGVSDTAGVIGTTATTGNGSVTVTGTGSSWTNSSALTVGSAGTGSLGISSGGTVSSTSGVIGSAVTGKGTVTVDGANSKWTDTGALTIGSTGTGNLTISNGGVVTNTTGLLGSATAGNGQVTVTGSGSGWTNSSTLSVGSNGSGSLSIFNGGTVSNTSGSVGVAATANGQVTVTGSGSGWTNSTTLTVGSAGTGSLGISNGGVVTNTSATIGSAATSNGTVTVDGANSQWTNTTGLTVGGAGTGALTISNGGGVSNTAGVIGTTSTTGNGTVTVTGSGSRWTNSTTLTVGSSGNASFNVLNGGTVSNTTGIIGANASSNSTATVDGANSKWNNSGALTIGSTGTGNLTISNGGVVSNTSGVIGSVGGTGNGSVTVTGSGSSWTNTSSVTVGNNGTGSLSIFNGGVVTNTSASIGNNAGSNGTATVDGANSKWTNAGALTIGTSGTGGLTVSNGGQVTSSVVTLGFSAAGVGKANISGTGSQWNISGIVTIGQTGQGSLTIQDHANVTASNAFTYLGSQNGSLGALDIESGGTLASVAVLLGFSAGAVGKAIVNGPGSNWTISNGSNAFVIGNNGTGSLLVSNGGSVAKNGDIQIGQSSGSLGSVTVTGTGSNLSGGNVYIGNAGQGTLSIANGATATTGSTYLASTSSSNGTLQIDGIGSSYSTGFLYAQTGATNISVTNGGTLTSTVNYLSNNAGSTTNVLIDGSGSNWTAANLLSLGTDGTSTLKLSNGGTLTVPGVTQLTEIFGSTGTLNIGAAPGNTPVAPGVLNTPTLIMGSTGTHATLNFNHTSSDYIFAPAITGYGTINAYAGTTELTGDLTGFTGITNLMGGNLLYSFNSGSTINTALSGSGDIDIASGGTTYLASDSHAFTGTTTVTDDSTLSVNGQLGGTVIVADGGTLKGHGTAGNVFANAGSILAPGNSIGTLTVGSLVTSPGSVYQAEINDAGGHDLIHATGTAVLNGGTVDVIYAPGNYTPGMSYTILTADGGVIGTFDRSSGIFLSSNLSYDANDVILTLTQVTPFTSVAQTPNQFATARALQSLGSGNAVYDTIVTAASAADARASFDNLSGAFHASTQSALLNEQHLISDALLARMDNIAGDHAVTQPFRVASQKQDLTGMIPATSKSGVWTQGFGDWSQFASNGNAAGIHNQNAGVLVGADKALNEHWQAGAAVGYSYSYLTGDKAHADSDNYHAALYAQRSVPKGPNVRFGGDYTWHTLDNHRTVDFTSYTAESEKANNNARSGQLFADISQPIPILDVPNATIAPFGTLAYLHEESDGYTESGGPAALSVGSSNMDVVSSTLGARFHKSVSYNSPSTTQHATMDGSMGWKHLSGQLTPNSTMQFASGSDGFTIGGTPLARDALVYDANIGVNLSEDSSLSLTYQGQLAHDVQEQTVGAKFTYKF